MSGSEYGSINFQPNNPNAFDYNIYPGGVSDPGHGHIWGNQNGQQGERPYHEFGDTTRDLGWLAMKRTGLHL